MERILVLCFVVAMSCFYFHQLFPTCSVVERHTSMVIALLGADSSDPPPQACLAPASATARAVPRDDERERGKGNDQPLLPTNKSAAFFNLLLVYDIWYRYKIRVSSYAPDL